MLLCRFVEAYQVIGLPRVNIGYPFYFTFEEAVLWLLRFSIPTSHFQGIHSAPTYFPYCFTFFSHQYEENISGTEQLFKSLTCFGFTKFAQQPVGLEESPRKSDWARADFDDFDGQ